MQDQWLQRHIESIEEGITELRADIKELLADKAERGGISKTLRIAISIISAILTTLVTLYASKGHV